MEEELDEGIGLARVGDARRRIEDKAGLDSFILKIDVDSRYWRESVVK